MDKVIVTPNDMPTVDIEQIPSNEMDALARATLRAVERFFAIPENKKKYEEWHLKKYGVPASD